MRRSLIALAAFLASAGAAWAQGAEVWRERCAAALHVAEDDKARLIGALDGTDLARIAEVSRARNVSAATLAAVTLRLGAALAENGHPADLAEILAAIDDGATKIAELEARIRTLEAGADPVLSAELARARAAIEAGDLDQAGALLREARKGAGLHQAEVIGLEANVAALRSDFLAAAALYEEAAATAPESATEAQWRFLMRQAGALRTRGTLFNEAQALREAVRLSEEDALPLAPQARDPQNWATTQNDLGSALLLLGKRGDDAALARAVAAFEAALTVRTRARDPAGWARTQVILGNALRVLGERGDDAALARAVAAFEAALSVMTRARDPAGWAMTQVNLGLAYAAKGDRAQAHGRPARAFYDQALAAYRGATAKFTPARALAPAFTQMIADHIARAERGRAAAAQ